MVYINKWIWKLVDRFFWKSDRLEITHLQVSTSLKTCNASNKIKTPVRYCFAANFVFTCESLLFFRGIISKFFTWTAVSNNTFEIHRNTSYCYPLKYKYNKWISLVNMKFPTKILAFYALQVFNDHETWGSYNDN